MEPNIPITTANPNRLLTPTEQDYLGIYAMGKTCSEAGLIKSRSARTAKAHLGNLYNKLNVHNRAQLVAQAFAKGYLKAGHTLLLLLAITAAVTDSNELRTPRHRNTRTARIKTARRQEQRINQTLDNFINREEWT